MALEEASICENEIIGIVCEWEKAKPTHGELRPRDALHVLLTFEERFLEVKEDCVNKVKKATVGFVEQEIVLEFAIMELNRLRSKGCLYFSLFFI